MGEETNQKSLKQHAEEYVLKIKPETPDSLRIQAVTRAYIYFLAGYGKDSAVTKLITGERKQLDSLTDKPNPLLDLDTNASGRYSEKTFDDFFQKHPEYKGLKKLEPLVELIKEEINYIRADHKTREIESLSARGDKDDIIFSGFLFDRKELVKAKSILNNIKVDGKKLVKAFSTYAALEIYQATTKAMKVEPEDMLDQGYRKLQQILKLELTAKPKTTIRQRIEELEDELGTAKKPRRGLVETPVLPGPHGMGLTRVK